MEHIEPTDCKCGHSWEDHHHGCMQNEVYAKYDDHSKGACQGIMAQECEATQVNGDWLVKEKDRCYCNQYEKP